MPSMAVIASHRDRWALWARRSYAALQPTDNRTVCPPGPLMPGLLATHNAYPTRSPAPTLSLRRTLHRSHFLFLKVIDACPRRPGAAWVSG